jgi:hypothetical protein
MSIPRIDEDFKRLLCPLTSEERAELEASILAEGVREALVVWGGQNILLDGHNRFAIAQAHDLPYRVREMAFADRSEARLWVLRNQLGRRNLKPDAASYLRGLLAREVPREVGGRPTGNSGQSVTSLQALAGETGVTTRTLHRDEKYADAVDTLTELGGVEVRDLVVDGSVTRGDATRLANTAKTDPERVKQAVQKVLSGEVKDPKHALAVVREERVKEKAKEFIGTDLLDLRQGPFQEVLAAQPDESIDFIFTDPPYGEEYLSLWGDLATVAARVLKPGGFLVTFVGKLHLPQCLRALDGALEYHWQCAVGYEGARKTVFGRRFWGQWRPLLVFVKGEANDHRYCNDMLYLTTDHRPDQSLHPWAQADAAAAYFIERLTEPGDTVLDPMCGTGTFIRAAAGLGRRGIGIEADAERYAICCGLSTGGVE